MVRRVWALNEVWLFKEFKYEGDAEVRETRWRLSVLKAGVCGD